LYPIQHVGAYTSESPGKVNSTITISGVRALEKKIMEDGFLFDHMVSLEKF
jgi:hypothetical protein